MKLLVLPSAFLVSLTVAPTAQEKTLSYLRDMLPPFLDDTEVVELGDLDNDGDLDLFAGNAKTSRTFLWSEVKGFVEVPGGVGGIAGGSAEAGALGDMDGDGNLDVVIGQMFGFSGNVLLGDGTGVMTWHAGAYPNITSISAIRLADFDADGDLDGAVSTEGGPNVILANDGTGLLTEVEIGTVSAYSRDLAVGDVDADGDDDIVVAELDEAHLLLNQGGLAFAPSVGAIPAQGLNTVAVELVDLNGDGDLDLFCGTDQGAGATDLLYAGDGSGSFALQVGLPGNLTESRGVTSGDFDSDGDVDVLMIDANLDDGPVLFRNEGGFVFTDATSQLVGDFFGMQAMAVGDIDVDGDLDAVLGGIGFNRVLLQGASGGVLHDVSDPWPDLVAWEVLAADFTGDDAPDVVGLANEPWIALNDGYGQLTTADPATLPIPEDYELEGLAAGDLDGDGDIDLIGVGYQTETRVFLNDGNGVFTLKSDGAPATFDKDFDVQLGDFDGDGDLDAFVSKHSSSDYVLWNDGAAKFTKLMPANATAHTRYARVGDINQTGHLDVFLGRNGILTDEWHWNDGTGVFTFAVAFPSNSPDDGILFDSDADGDLDVFSTYTLNQYLYRNNGIGIFTDLSATLPSQGSTNVHHLLAIDVEGDGDLDVLGSVVTDTAKNLLYKNDGSGAFTLDSSAIVDLPAESREGVVTDLDRDGDADIVMVGVPGTRVLNGLERQLARKGEARLGKPLGLDLYGPAAELWFLAYAPQLVTTDLGPYGLLHLDPATALVIASGVLDGDGRASVTVTFPNDPTLLGVPLGLQGAVGNAPAFTNLERIVGVDL